jgi:hypothetical protein
MAVGRGHATVRLHVERCQLTLRAALGGMECVILMFRKLNISVPIHFREKEQNEKT